jgi:predicted kinase/diadenosine tetraphosphatase ApaH/serine/threonine PP2A family protein phosphatase
MIITIPRTALVVLCGPAGSGKSTFARRHFQPTQIVSSDHCRALISDSPQNQAVSADAFALFYTIIDLRLKYGRLTVADSTALTRESRAELLALAHRHDFAAIMLLFDTPLDLCIERDRQRQHPVGPAVIRRQWERLADARAAIHHEPFEAIYYLSPEDVDAVTIKVVPLNVEHQEETGPFDIIGDVHGCWAELQELLTKLGWERDGDGFRHPAGRKAIFVGDLTDRGPNSVAVLRCVIAMVRAGQAMMVVGNHDQKLLRALKGHAVEIAKGLETTMGELDALPPGERESLVADIRRLIENAPAYLILNHGRLVVAHAGIEERMIGRLSRRIWRFCCFGALTGEITPEGLPVRRNWAADYHGRALVVYGHTPTPEPRFYHNTINIDQGCVFGGALTALRYPEMELVHVEAHRLYYYRPRFTPEKWLAGEAHYG